MRKSLKMLGDVAKRLAAAGVAAAMALSMAITGPVTALATEGASGVTIDKTATDLVDDTTNVTLSVGATQSEKNVAVLFVLDYSTSVSVRSAAAAMLEELASKTNTNVKACVINYWANADTGTWTTVDETTDTNALLSNTQEGGTNYHAGLLAAQAALQSSEIAGYDTYLVTISDGITYLWTGDDGKTLSVWYQNRGNGEQDIQNGNSVYDMKYGQGNPIPEDTFNALVSGNIGELLSNTSEYFTEYGSAKPDPSDTDSFISYYGTEEEYAYNKANYLIGTEIAISKTAAAWNQLVGSVDHAYALKLDENHWGSYPYGVQLMDYMSNVPDADGGAITESTAANVFSGIADEIIYEIKSGTVIDVIGAAFDLAGVDTFTMTVGDQTLEGIVEGNTVSFAGGNYEVTYYPEGDAEHGEYFTWTINVPVEQANGITLSYTLKLVDKATAAGDYPVPTNEKATIEYEGTDGTEGEDTFPVPEVTYTVEEAPVEPQQPEQPQKPAADKKEPLAQTGDPTSFVALGVLLATGVGAGAAGVIVKRRNR